MSLKLEETAENFPSNIGLEEEEEIQTPKQNLKVNCTICERKSKSNVEAVLFCSICSINLCRSCENNFHSFLGHQTKPIISNTTIQNSTELRCKIHKKKYKLYCQTCEKTICYKCAIFDCKKHIIIELEKAVEYIKETKIPKEEELETFLNNRTKKLQKLENKNLIIDQKNNELIKESQNKITILTEALLNQQEKILKRINKLIIDQKDMITAEISTTKKELKILEKNNNILKSENYEGNSSSLDTIQIIKDISKELNLIKNAEAKEITKSKIELIDIKLELNIKPLLELIKKLDFKIAIDYNKSIFKIPDNIFFNEIFHIKMKMLDNKNNPIPIEQDIIILFKDLSDNIIKRRVYLKERQDKRKRSSFIKIPFKLKKIGNYHLEIITGSRIICRKNISVLNSISFQDSEITFQPNKIQIGDTTQLTVRLLSNKNVPIQKIDENLTIKVALSNNKNELISELKHQKYESFSSEFQINEIGDYFIKWFEIQNNKFNFNRNISFKVVKKTCIDDKFNITASHKDLKFSDNFKTVTKSSSKSEMGAALGSYIYESGEYVIKFRIIKCTKKGYLYIGARNPLQYQQYYRFNPNESSGPSLYGQNKRLTRYGRDVFSGDIVKMYLNMNKKTISFSINKIKFPIAFDVVSQKVCLEINVFNNLQIVHIVSIKKKK
ncbi:tripartite motif-containing 33 [Anaeramoeba flamelloides]|uniref:Tripartite motif-containing 33 n=1 Tax=Anaeramoeba flamelloides TaxID=1746091 RepID=A0ABQ8X3Y6_9EUKA|nr:tripartite motif-containing 33 [Anaeramoeba flamelloides]